MLTLAFLQDFGHKTQPIIIYRSYSFLHVQYIELMNSVSARIKLGAGLILCVLHVRSSSTPTFTKLPTPMYLMKHS